MTGKDDGIFDAINKGSFAAQGELLGFLGCDDILLPGALEQVVQTYEPSGRRWVVVGIRWLDGCGTPAATAPPPELDHRADVRFARVELHHAHGHLRELGNVS